MERPNATYSMKTEQYDVDYESYVNFEKVFGHFGEDGKSYVVTDRNTPRQWLNFMVNDKFGSVAGNDGSGFIMYEMGGIRVTKYQSNTDYLVRTLNGRRQVVLTDTATGESYDLLKDSKDMRYTVRPGSVEYAGSVGGVCFSMTVFVPETDACECWILRLKSATEREMELSVSEDISLGNTTDSVNFTPEIEYADGGIYVSSKFEKYKKQRELICAFSLLGSVAKTQEYVENYTETYRLKYEKTTLTKKITLSETERVETVVCAVSHKSQRKEAQGVVEKYSALENVLKEKDLVDSKWQERIQEDYCELPDKNLQYFLNVWLKNQLYVTARYNRFDLMGYRDVLQDAWGHLYVGKEKSKEMLLTALSNMYDDGRCPRQYDLYSDYLDDRDFMDSPLWAPILLVPYIKETGDFGILREKLPYLQSEKSDTVLEHILLSLDYLYRSRGKNGLILMRKGDWLDGLTGIDQYGEATTVWGTIATFYAQNLTVELLERIGERQTAELLKARSAEYKKIVNEVGWDGKWYVYAFVDDTPIGGHVCPEGKIYLNSQTWAILSGVYDDPRKLEQMYLSVHTYLSSVHGPHLMFPAYTKYGEKCGRIARHRPGTFSNGAIYLHGAAFKVAADCACGKYDEALDTFSRILPNHRDGCDTRRTSEPYCVGNVYYGVTHPCHGLNLYTWFTATPAWLIHDGFELLLGVKAEYDGLKIEPRDIDGWGAYKVEKTYRGTHYKITFERGKNKGVFVDGKKTEGLVISTEKECTVRVIY
ncbi:MAG: hypothetical protein IJX91_03550 [Clostridia bacterium]|nr:hypothetical protein [Clostridia bacterium]